MASDDLDIPQITAVGVQDDNGSGPTLDPPPATSSDNTSFPLSPMCHAGSPPDNHGFLSLSTPILRDSRNSLDVPDSPAPHTSDASSLNLPPSLTLSAHSSGLIRWATSTLLRDNNPEEHDGPDSLRKGSTDTVTSIGSSSTDRGLEDSPILGLGPVHSGRSNVPSTHPSPTDTHVDVRSEPSRSSSAAGFFKRTVQRIRRPSPARPAVPGLRQEAGMNVEPFAFKSLQLTGLVGPKNLENLENLGGVDGLIRGLGTNRLRGLSTKPTPPGQLGSPDLGTVNAPNIVITSPAGVPERLHSTASLGGGSSVGHPTPFKFLAGAYEATIEDRQRIYGQNIAPQCPNKSILLLVWQALWDKVLVLSLIAAVVSLALGLFQDFGTTHLEGVPLVDWVEDVAVIAAILIVVVVNSLNDWQKERQFKVPNEKKEDRLVKVIRDGRERQIDVHQVVVGDVVLLEPGEVIPCDGVLLSGHNVRCDESNATGGSDAIRKLSYEDCIALRGKRLLEFDPDGPSGDGEIVLEGVGSYIAISVGTKSFNGRIMMALRHDSEKTPLQLKLNELANAITKIGSIAGGLLFGALLVRYFVQRINNSQRTSIEEGVAFVNIFIVAVVVAVPQGLPLAFNLALALAAKRTNKENLLVRVPGSCETMANASVICTGKTGTLTRNEMAVFAGSVGVHAKFVRRLVENHERIGSEARRGPNAKDFIVDLANLNTVLSHPLKDLFNAAIAINSTAFEDVDQQSGVPAFIGCKTETALLEFAKELGWPNCRDTRDSASIIQMIPFSSDRKFMGCVVRLPDGSHRLYIKGASEILTRKCTRHVVVHHDAENEAPNGNEVETVPIGEMEEDNISRTITFYASQALRTISLCYRDLPYWPPQGARLLDNGEVDYDDLTTDLTLIGITGIEDHLRAGVREAVANCGRAGVRVKMCTGDNVLTARSIAQQCGIYTAGGIVMEGPHFRTLSPDVMKAIVPRLQVLARSSPKDKLILVETLKELGNIVGVTGDGVNDGPALKTAHVGFSMGFAGTEVAKEASDIILMDDNFSSIVNAIMWGRCVNDTARKCLQFQISTNVTAVVITFVSALASSKEGVLSAAQWAWINLIMNPFSALALATDPASPVLLNRKLDKTGPLFTADMIKQILGQAVCQIIIILIFHFLGSQILGFHHSDESTPQKHHDRIVQMLIFHAFMFAQIFNSFNCRRLDRKLNVFEGVLKNWYFIAITIIEVAIQVLIFFVGGPAFDVTLMGVREWGISLALGCVSLPLGALIRLIPNEPCERVFKELRLLPKTEALPTTRPDAEPGFSFAVDQVRDNSVTFSELRRGRMCESSFVRTSCSAFPDPDSPRLGRRRWSRRWSRLMASDRRLRINGSLSDSAGFDPSRSSAALWENKFEVYPDTPRDDPVYRLLGMTAT
ncbi:calcium-translocating P-type ATPase [Lactarius psammicola]|nr:calcium-translocating P-type ATPase [Lactarius psammicola]